MVQLKELDRTMTALVDTFAPPRRYALTPDELERQDEADQQQMKLDRQELDKAAGEPSAWPQASSAEINTLRSVILRLTTKRRFSSPS